MSRTSQAIRDEIATVDPSARAARARHRAFTGQIANWESAMTAALTDHHGDQPPEHAGTSGHQQSPLIGEIIGGRECLRLIEASPHWATVTDYLDPRHLELDAALAREAAEADRISDAMNAVSAAEEAAREKLLAKLDADPGLKAAREKLAGLQPAPEPVDPAIASARATAAATPRLGKPLGDLPAV